MTNQQPKQYTDKMDIRDNFLSLYDKIIDKPLAKDVLADFLETTPQVIATHYLIKTERNRLCKLDNTEVYGMVKILQNLIRNQVGDLKEALRISEINVHEPQEVKE